MFCLKCGEAIPDESKCCPKCGADLTETANDEQFVVYASQNTEMPNEPATTNVARKGLSKKLIAVLAAVVCVIGIFVAVTETGKANLKKDLVKTWYASGDSIVKVLDISDDEAEYRLETGYSWMDTTLGTYEWKAVGKNKIEMKRSSGSSETYTVELNDDKDVLTISPAITSLDSSETWYDID